MGSEAGRLWRRHFGHIGLGGCKAEKGAVAVSAGQVQGVIGFRDHRGGFAQPGRGALVALAEMLYRPAPSTADLVIAGIAVRRPRCGYGRALIAQAVTQAQLRGRAGLRAEVALRNRRALAFYRKLGFVEEGRGRYGWPWTGIVVILRRPV